jgi:hypothetical protein
MTIDENMLFLRGHEGVRSYQLDNQNPPVQSDSIPDNGSVEWLERLGDALYLGFYSNTVRHTLQIINIADPEQPRFHGVIGDSAYSVKLSVWDSTLVTGDQLFDCSNSLEPRLAGEWRGRTDYWTAANDYIAALYTDTLYTLDISDPYDLPDATLVPIEISVHAYRMVDIFDGSVYITEVVHVDDSNYQSTIRIVPANDPGADPALIELPDGLVVLDLAIKDGYLLIMSSSANGEQFIFHGYDVIQPTEPRFSFSHEFVRGTLFTEMKVFDDQLFLMDNGVINIFARSYTYGGGVSVWDITEPWSPHRLGRLDVGMLVHDVEIKDNCLYIATGSSVRIFDFEDILPVQPEPPVVSFSPAVISLFPSPFNSSTTITFSLPSSSSSSLVVYDLQGRMVADLLTGWKPVLRAGEHKVVWDAGDTPNGLYIIRLEQSTSIATRKVVLIK